MLSSKLLAVVAAVFLGLAVMTLPILVLFTTGFNVTTSNSEGVYGSIINKLSRQIESLRRETMDTGLIRFPTSLLHAGLILLVGTAAAAILYLAIERKWS